MKVSAQFTLAVLGMAIGVTAQAASVDLGGQATGFVALQNAKNSTTQNGIEGKNASGVFDPNHNGLPEYPNFQVPSTPGNTWANDGIYSAIIASPQSASNNYAAAFAQFYPGADPLVINNQTITQANATSISSGRIDYDESLVSPTGTTVIPVSALTFNFNTYQWDGRVTPEQTGDSRSNYPAAGVTPVPRAISPFSPVYQPYNDGSGAGNAQFFYDITLDKTKTEGAGLTFVDGQLVSMDITPIAGQQNLNLAVYVAPFVGFGSASYPGTFSASDLDYAFDVSGTKSLVIFSGMNLVMNRAGMIPEPASMLAVSGFAALALRRRRVA